MSIKNIPFNRAVAAGKYSQGKVLKMQSMHYLSALCVVSMAVFSGEAAYALELSAVSSGYSNCSYKETDTVATFNVTVAYNAVARYSGVYEFYSRSLLIYAYNERGVLQASSNLASSMTLNGVSYVASYGRGNYLMYFGDGTRRIEWGNANAHIATFMFTVLKSKIASWPALSVRAGNYKSAAYPVNPADFGEIAGMAYIGPTTKGGNCNVITNPELPPPAEIPKVTMTAPDWDLGELPRGKVTISDLSEAKDQLCFSYEGSTALTDQKYLINATNSNGLSANGRYLLKSLEDSSQTVPYTLTLNNSKSSVLLPNTKNHLFSLEAGGKTCFNPTFKSEPDKAVKAGAYSDILTFTVVAKP